MRGAIQTSVHRQLLTCLTTNLMSKPTDIPVSPYNHSSFFSQFFAPPIMKEDSGASKNFTREQDMKQLQNTKKIHNGPEAMFPNKEVISPTHSGNLNLSPALSSTALQSLVYPNITNDSLLSIGKLFEDDCVAFFKKFALCIFKNDKFIIQGTRNTKEGLWGVPFQDPKTSIYPSTTSPKNLALSYIIQRDKTKSDLALYLHGCVFYPVLSTFQKSISNNNFVSCPGIEDINFSKVIGITSATAKGNFDQERRNL